MPLGMEVGLGPGHIVLDGDPAPLPKRGHCRQFSANVYCGQTAGWIKMPLDVEVGLGPDHIVLDGDPAAPIRAQSPNFRPVSIVAKRSPISATAEHLFCAVNAPIPFPILRCGIWSPWQRPFTNRETNARLNIYTSMSTIPENLAKIGLVVSEMSLLQSIVKKESK